MLNIGRLCVKTAGRDATKYCVVVEEVDSKYVIIDGYTRKKKVNKAHIEPLNKVLKIDSKSTSEDIRKAIDESLE